MKKKRVNLRELCGLPALRLIVVALCLAAYVLFPVVSSAFDMTGTSSTYVPTRESSDKSLFLPLYEYLDVSVQKNADSSFSAHFGGWGRYDLGGESFGKKSDTDLQYGYLSYRKATDNTLVNLGRVMVFEGVAIERIDGLYGRTDLKGGFGVSAFGGRPVETGINFPGNNVIYGARLSQGNADMYKIGLSYLQEQKDSSDFRKEEGVDIWLQPVSKVALVGKSTYNMVTSGWMEHTYSLSFGPFDKLKMGLDFSKINYGDYFGAATMTAFMFKPGILDAGEKARILGASASYAVLGNMTVSVDYQKYGYSIAGDATSMGAKVVYSSPESGGGGFSYRRMDGDDAKLKYSEYRIYCYKKAGHADIGVELFDAAYDEAINGVKSAYSASIGAGYELSEQLKLGADFEYAKNPDFDQDVRAFIKVIYKFGAEHGARKGA